MKLKNQKGQAVLVVLLSLAVVLVVVMFTVSRSITDISLSTKEEDSLRAFSAAEAGIERALVIGDYNPGSFGDASFTGSVTDFAAGLPFVVYPSSLKSGESAIFWLTRPNETGFAGKFVKLCWGDEGTSINATTPAVEFTVYYTPTVNNLESLKIARATFDPTSRANNFSPASIGTCTIDGENFKFYTTIDLSNASGGLGIAKWNISGVEQYITAKILYNDVISHKVGIDISMNNGKVLPSQGSKIESSGTYGDANRSIEVYQLHPVTPSIFENALYSSDGIVQNN